MLLLDIFAYIYIYIYEYLYIHLRRSAMNGHMETTKLLLSSNADASIINDFGETAVQCAELNGHYEIASYIGNTRRHSHSPSSSSISLPSMIETLNLILENEVETFCRRSLSIVPRLFE